VEKPLPPTNPLIDRIRAAAPDLRPSTVPVLAEMYGATTLRGTESDQPITLNPITRISIEQGAMLHRLAREHRVQRSLEVGLAYGFSTVWLLDALAAQAEAVHIAIDPFQKTGWGGIGLAQAARVDFAGRFDWLPEYSIHALSDLIRQQQRFDFIYIDGNHRFDDVMVDFYLADQLMRPGGLIVLDDLWMPSIRTVADFIFHNRAYELVPQPVGNIAVLLKQRDDDRDWKHFVRFNVHPAAPLSRADRIIQSLKKRATRLQRSFRPNP
jgi:predicted O-methyltransferase YrrM